MRWVALCLAFGLSADLRPASVRQRDAPRLTKVILRVEAQGPEGLWTQLGKDLSAAELTDLRSTIAKEISRLPNHKLVSPDDKDDALGLAVVAEKLQSGRNSYVLISSALTIAKADQTDLLFTHDVIAQSSIALAAHAVVGQLVGAELRALTGIARH